jgi:DUF1680 family protein
MVQDTDYPWSGDVSIIVNPAAATRFSMKIRVPDRDVSDLYTGTPDSDGITSISVNGSALKPHIEKGYATITREWKAGDRIDLVLPMKVQRIKGNNKIEATTGRVALRYSPLIYNVEQVDQNITQILNPESALTPQWQADLLGGIMVLKGTWADGSELTAIPNYARANRTSGDAERRGPGGRAPSSIVWIGDQ